jgi:hypothetical protein
MKRIVGIEKSIVGEVPVIASLLETSKFSSGWYFPKTSGMLPLQKFSPSFRNSVVVDMFM